MKLFGSDQHTLGQAGIRALSPSTPQGTTVCVAYRPFQASKKDKTWGQSSSNVIADYDALVLVPELCVPVFQTSVTNDAASLQMVLLCVGLFFFLFTVSGCHGKSVIVH